jgi:hypothetical protein
LTLDFSEILFGQQKLTTGNVILINRGHCGCCGAAKYLGMVGYGIVT